MQDWQCFECDHADHADWCSKSRAWREGLQRLASVVKAAPTKEMESGASLSRVSTQKGPSDADLDALMAKLTRAEAAP